MTAIEKSGHDTWQDSNGFVFFFFATTVSEVQKAMQFWYLFITSWSGRNHSLQFGIIFDHFFLSI